MRRREFLSILAFATAWPVASTAQTTERTRVIGVLQILGADDPEAKTRSEVFAQALQQLGWSVGRNLKIEIRYVGRSRPPSRLLGGIDRAPARRHCECRQCYSCTVATSHSYHPD